MINVGADDQGSGVRLAELLAAFSLATDLGMGQPLEHVLRSWRIAGRLGERLALDALRLLGGAAGEPGGNIMACPGQSPSTSPSDVTHWRCAVSDPARPSLSRSR